MKQIFTLFCLLLIWLVPLVAQVDSCNFSISGTVLDAKTKEPVPYASIKLFGEEKFTTTNIKGEYTFKSLCTDDNTLIISCIGYSESICNHHHEHGRSPHFYLTQKVHQIESVLIEAEEIKEEGTQSIAQVTISKEMLTQNPSQSLAASVASVDGVSFISTGSNVQLPIIHGLYGNRVLIVNNGIKHGFQNWNRDHAPEIDVSSANSITVLKGAAGVRFGPEALGGAIIIESNPLYRREPFYLNMGTSYETNGQGLSSNLELGQGFKNWSYFLNGNYTKIGDRQSAEYNLTNSGKEEKSFGFGTRYHLKNFDVKVYYSFVDQNLALLRSSIAESGNSFVRAINSDEPIIINPFSYEINEPNQLTQHHFGKVEMNWWYSEKAKLTFRAGRQLNFREEYDVRRNADKPIIDLDLITSDYQLEWKHSGWFKSDGLIGLQYFSQKNRNNPGTGTTAFIPNYDTKRLSAFLIESKKIGTNTLELGFRVDFENNFITGRETSQAIFSDEYSFNNITASVGYVKEISETISFRTNLGTAWRAPNMAELYSFGQHGFKSSFGLLRYYTNNEGRLRTNRIIEFTDSGVEAEKGYKFINELKVNNDKNRHAITLYSHYIENYIFDRPLAVIGTIRGPMPVFIFDQADALFAGVDYNWERQVSEQLLGTFGFSYLWSRNIAENEPLINQPSMQVNYELSWNQPNFWKFESSKLSLKPTYTFRQFQAPKTVSPESLINGSETVTQESEIFDFTDAPNGYFILNLAWRFKWENFGGSITVENLLNNSYRDYLNEMRYFADELGRNIRFTINYQFKAKKS